MIKKIKINNDIYGIKECPLCGHIWQDKDDFLYYKCLDKKSYKLLCNTIEGGCGLVMVGNNLDEVIKKWNTRKGIINE